MASAPGVRRIPLIPMMLAVLFTGASSAEAQTTLIDLGTLGGTQSNGTAINGTGQVVGYATLPGDTTTHAFLYSNGTITDLGTLGGDSYGYGINSAGQVVGNSNGSAFLYSGGVMQNIAPSVASVANGINDSGVVVGTLQPSLCSTSCTVFTYANGTLTNTGVQGLGRGINDAGTVVGNTASANPGPFGFFYANGTVQYVTSGQTESHVVAVNATGQAVGDEVASGGFTSEAAMFSGGSVQLLGFLQAGESSTAYAINASGEIVGSAFVANGAQQHAFLYVNGQMEDLNSLDESSPLAMYVTLTRGDAINGQGWIVADGIDSRTGQAHAYLVENIATPLPGALWLMLSGVGGLAACARGRRNSAQRPAGL